MKEEADNKDLPNNLFYLGKICPRKHDYQNTGKALRYKSNFDCKECSILLRGQRKNSRARIFPNKNAPQPEGILVPDNHYLGLLCKREHDYMQTGYSLRNSRRTCIVCISLKSRGTQAKERIERWKKAKPDYMSQYLQAYYQTNKQTIIQKSKEYQKTAKGKACKAISRHKRRARMAIAPRVPYTASELVAHFQSFKNECVYCGTKENLTADHVIPIAEGGYDALSNILPCCLSCNCSKQDRDYLEWYSQSPHFYFHRLAKIADFLRSRKDTEGINP
ncbi:HNH endonuclease [Nostoc sp.]